VDGVSCVERGSFSAGEPMRWFFRGFLGSVLVLLVIASFWMPDKVPYPGVLFYAASDRWLSSGTEAETIAARPARSETAVVTGKTDSVAVVQSDTVTEQERHNNPEKNTITTVEAFRNLSQARMEKAAWVAALSPLFQQIEGNAARLGSFQGAGNDTAIPRLKYSYVSVETVSEDGVVRVWSTTTNQHFIFTPGYTGEGVRWSCRADPDLPARSAQFCRADVTPMLVAEPAASVLPVGAEPTGLQK